MPPEQPSPPNNADGGAGPIVPDDAALSEIAPSVLLQSEDLALREVDALEHERKSAELKGFKQDIKARKRYAKNIFSLIVWWLVAILFLLLLQGFSGGQKVSLSTITRLLEVHLDYKFYLSDAVLLALIGGTTANVLGLFIFVVQYLFPKRIVDKST
jgi:hypothetical protein